MTVELNVLHATRPTRCHLCGYRIERDRLMAPSASGWHHWPKCPPPPQWMD